MIEEAKITKLFRADILMSVGIVGATVTVLGFFFSPVLRQNERIGQLEAQFNANKSVLDAVTNLKDNHVHTLEEKVDQLQGQINQLKDGQTRVETILEERLPKKIQS